LKIGFTIREKLGKVTRRNLEKIGVLTWKDPHERPNFTFWFPGPTKSITELRNADSKNECDSAVVVMTLVKYVVSSVSKEVDGCVALVLKDLMIRT